MASVDRSRSTEIDVVAALAGRAFESTEEALDAVFAAMRDLLGMRSLFLSRIDQEHQTLRVIAAANAPGGCDVEVGTQAPLGDTY